MIADKNSTVFIEKTLKIALAILFFNLNESECEFSILAIKIHLKKQGVQCFPGLSTEMNFICLLHPKILQSLKKIP